MTIETPTPETCQGRYYARGADQPCTQRIALHRWFDTSGVPHAACPTHRFGIERRYPVALPESVPDHGRLNLVTPWARGAFGPADRIEIENLIPSGWSVTVTAAARPTAPSARRYIFWATDPDRTERARWTDQRPAVERARAFVAAVRELAEAVPDPITEAKAEAERDPEAPDPSWTTDADGYAREPLSYENREGDPAFNGAFNRW